MSRAPRSEQDRPHPTPRENRPVTDAAEFVDAALRRESSEYRAADDRERLGNGTKEGAGESADLVFYGASVGAIRGTMRDAAKRYPGMTHDEVTALASELWSAPVFERRLAAVVLLQSNARLLDNSDLTRIEGFVRGARLRELVDPLAIDVVGPMIETLDATHRARADATLDRWAHEPDVWLRRAALLTPLRALRAGGGDWDGFGRRARGILSEPYESAIVAEAIERVLDDVAKSRPDLART